MAGETNTNIHIGIDTSQAMAQLRALEKELTAVNRAMIAGTASAAREQSRFAQSLLHNVNATGQWAASTMRMSTATEQFSNRLDRGKLSLKEYYRYGMASTKTFGRFFGNEFNTLSKLVDSRVKTLQQQYIQLGRDAQGAMQAMQFRPKALNYGNATTQLMMATQRAQIFNKIIDDGATKLLNFGKNTQWAGRQLMVGFTIPLMLFASQAIKAFKEIETQIIRFKKVYGDIYTNSEDTAKALKNIQAMADEYTKYGIKVADTIKLAADAAAAGNSGKQLESLVEQTTKLAVLGGVTQEKALETTIALQNAFNLKGKDLNQTIDFLNAVENQTVVALEDLTTAIPKVAPVIQQLGGDVKDLSFFMAAMQEGGISAAQGANALKSGLGSLINPSNKAAKAAAAVGVNIRGIVESNAGNLRNTVVQFAEALKPLTDLQRTRVIEDVFGKYQFARISALLNNISKEGTQAARVLQLTNASAEELAILSQREMKIQSDSQMNKLAGSIERLKASIAPIGELFASVLTPVAEFFKKMFDKFNNLPEGVKKAITVVTAVIGGIGPILLMTVGLVANGIANLLKLFNLLRKGYQQLAWGSSDVALKTQYLSQEELENASISNALYSKHMALSAAYELESTALQSLMMTYRSASTAMGIFSANNPGMFMPRGLGPKRFATGTPSVPGPKGAGDVVPAMLSPGEAVIPVDKTQKYGGFISQILADKVPGFATGPGFWTPPKVVGTLAHGEAALLGGAKPKATVFGKAFALPRDMVVAHPTDPNMVKLRVGSAEFDFKSSALPAFEEKYAKYVQDKVATKNIDEISAMRMADEYIAARITRKIAEGKIPPAPSVSTIFGQTKVGGGGARKKNAPADVKAKFTKAVQSGSSQRAAALSAEFDSEIAYLRNSGALSAEELAIIEKGNGFKADVSHLDPLNRTKWDSQYVARDLGIINKTMAYERNKSGFGGMHILSARDAESFLSYLRSPGVNLTAQKKAAALILERRLSNGFYSRHDIRDTALGLKAGTASAMGGPVMLSPGEAVIPTEQAKRHQSLISSMIAGTVPEHMAGVFLGMPKGYAKMLQIRQSEAQVAAAVEKSTLKNVAPTNFGHLIQPFSGHSFPIPGVGGVYRKPDGSLVVVKPVVDELAAMAEVRATQIAREAHGLESPTQTIRTMMDPTDVTGKRKLIVLESPYNPTFANPTGKFSKDEYFKQLVASTLRGDKDLQMSNLSGNMLADVGPAGVFAKASGFREYETNMLSMEEQARINLLGVKGGAKKFFAEATADIPKSMTAMEYQAAVIREIETVLPKLKKTIEGFGLSGAEKAVYANMIARLEAGKKANWAEIHGIHSKVTPKKYAKGVLTVPGPKGAGDIQPAMLSPGEAVIPAAMAEKYAPLIGGMISGTIPEHGSGKGGKKGGIPRPLPGQDFSGPSPVKKNWRGKMYAARDAAIRSRDMAAIKAIDIQSRVVAKNAAILDKTVNSVKVNGKKVADTLKATAAAQKANAAATAAVSKNMMGLNDSVGGKTTGFRGWLTGYGGVPKMVTGEDGVSRAATAEERTNMRQLKRQNVASRWAGIGMASMMVPMVAGAYAQKNPESGIAKNLDKIMFASMIPMLIPLFNSPLKALAAAAIAVTAAFMMQKKAIHDAIVAGVEQGKQMGMTTQMLEEFGKITGRVSATQIQAEKRKQNSLEITPVSQRFGAQFAGSDFGKKFIDNFKKVASTAGLNAGQVLATQLGSAVSQGVIDFSQAESIIVNIARGMNDQTLELNARAQLREIAGPAGENLLKDPLNVQTRLLLNNAEIQKDLQASFMAVAEKEMGGNWFGKFVGLGTGINKGEALQLAGTGVAGLGVGGYYGVKTAGAVAKGMQGMGIEGTLLKESRLGMAGKNAAVGIRDMKSMKAIADATKGLKGFSTASKVLTGIKTARTAATVAEAGVASTGVGLVPALAGAAVTTAIFSALEFGVRKWQQGAEKKKVGAVAGMAVGDSSQNIAAVSAAMDAISQQEDVQLRKLKTELDIAKTAEKRLDIEKKMADVRSQSDKDRSTLAQYTGDIFKSTADFMSQISSDEARAKVVEASTTAYQEYFKGKVGPEKDASLSLQTKLDPNAGLLKTEGLLKNRYDITTYKAMQTEIDKLQTKVDANAKAGVVDQALIDKLTSKKMILKEAQNTYDTTDLSKTQQETFQINVQNAISGGTLSAVATETLIDIMNTRGEDYTQKLQFMLETQGTAEVSRLGLFLSNIPEKSQTNLYVASSGMSGKELNELNNGLDEFYKLPPDTGINLALEVNGTDDIDKLKQYGKEVTDLKKRFPDNKISKMSLELYQKSIGGEGKNLTLDAAIKNWELLKGFDPNIQLSAVFTLGAFNISDSIDQEVGTELKNKFKELNPTVNINTTAGAAKYEAWRKTEEAKTLALQIEPEIKEQKLKDIYAAITAQMAAERKAAALANAPKEDKSWIENLLQQLKLVKEASINAKGGLAELESFLSGKKKINIGLNEQQGALKQIEAAAKNYSIKGKNGKITKKPLNLSPEFMDFIKNLDAEQYKFFEKRFLNMKGGKIQSLKPEFATANEGFNIKGIGMFLNDSTEVNKELESQDALFRKLIDPAGKYKWTIEQAAWAMENAALAAALMKKEELSPAELKQANDEYARRVAILAKGKQVEMTKDVTKGANQLKAFSILTKAGVKFNDALDVSKVEEYATQIALLYADADKEGQMTATRAEEIRNKFAQYTADVKKLRDQAFALEQISESPADKLTEKFAAENARMSVEAMKQFRKVNGMTLDQYQVITKEKELIKQGLQEQIDAYNEGVSAIDKLETKINETYDAKFKALDEQATALDKISSINEDILAQQKAQLDVADAITTGDIASAARAAQAYREQQAQAAAQRSQEAIDAKRVALEKQKQKDIDSLVATVNGKQYTRKQLADEISKIEDGSLKSIDKEIVDRNKIIAAHDLALEKAQAGLTIQGYTSAEWESIKSAVAALNDAYDTQVTNIDEIATSVSGVSGAWDAVTTAIKNASLEAGKYSGYTVTDQFNPKKDLTADKPPVKEMTAEEEAAAIAKAGAKKTAIAEAQKAIDAANSKMATAKSLRFAIGQHASAEMEADAQKLLDAANAKMAAALKMSKGGIVPSYFANGGYAFGTDTVPAMLTPGEFVVKKFAVDRFGVDNLKAINNGSFRAGSNTVDASSNYNTVYNYSVGVTVGGSNVSADEVARAVITQIKQLDNQKVRGQRI